MLLDAATLPLVTPDGWRILEALERGHKEAEYVPEDMICRLGKLRRQGVHTLLGALLKDALIVYEKCAKSGHTGYRLTWTGYDFLALRALLKTGRVHSVGPRIGVGKEADVHVASYDPPEGGKAQTVCIKVHRLGRTSFRTASTKRSYLRPGEKRGDWMRMSCRSAEHEFRYMRELYGHELPVPVPIAQNRHMILMSYAPGVLMNKLRNDSTDIQVLTELASDLFGLLTRLLTHGLVHGDFNEFNLIVELPERLEDNPRVTMIDFPQMVQTSHPDAKDLFERDAQSIKDFFFRRFNVELDDLPVFEDYVVGTPGVNSDTEDDSASTYDYSSQADTQTSLEAATVRRLD